MSRIEVGMEVRHKASDQHGVVTKIEGDQAEVSYDFDQSGKVPLAALEPIEEDDGPLYIEPSM